MALKQVSVVPAGVPGVNLDAFLASTHALSEGTPSICRKHMLRGMSTESLGMIGCIFAENGPLEGGIKSSLNGTIRGAKVDFIRFSCLYPYICESRTLAFSKAHALSYTHSKVGNDRVHIRGEIPSKLKNHILAPILMEIWQFWNVFCFSPFWPSYLTFYL